MSPFSLFGGPKSCIKVKLYTKCGTFAIPLGYWGNPAKSADVNATREGLVGCRQALGMNNMGYFHGPIWVVNYHYGTNI